MSHLGKSESRSILASSFRIAFLVSGNFFLVDRTAQFHDGVDTFPGHTLTVNGLGVHLRQKIRHLTRVEVGKDRVHRPTPFDDPEHNLEECIINEQFLV